MRRLEPSHLDLCCLQKPNKIACGSERVKNSQHCLAYSENTSQNSKLLETAGHCPPTIQTNHEEVQKVTDHSGCFL